MVSLGENCCSAVLYSSLLTIDVFICNLACPYFILFYVVLRMLSIRDFISATAG